MSRQRSVTVSEGLQKPGPVEGLKLKLRRAGRKTREMFTKCISSRPQEEDMNSTQSTLGSIELEGSQNLQIEDVVPLG